MSKAIKLLIVGDVVLVLGVLACLYLQAYQSGVFLSHPAIEILPEASAPVWKERAPEDILLRPAADRADLEGNEEKMKCRW